MAQKIGSPERFPAPTPAPVVVVKEVPVAVIKEGIVEKLVEVIVEATKQEGGE